MEELDNFGNRFEAGLRVAGVGTDPASILSAVDRYLNRARDPVFRSLGASEREAASSLVTKAKDGSVVPSLYRCKQHMTWLQTLLQQDHGSTQDLLADFKRPGFFEDKTRERERQVWTDVVGSDMCRMLHSATNPNFGPIPGPNVAGGAESPWFQGDKELKVLAEVKHERNHAILAVKIAFVVLALVMLVWTLVAAFVETEVPPELEITVLCLDFLVLAGLAALLVGVFRVLPSGFFTVPHPSDQFFAMFAGILFGVIALKTLGEIVHFAKEHF